MSEFDPQPPAPGKPVPDLIEQYRIRRDAWIAQADELARLRDEVRGSAEREAMEIVTAARRDVRQIVMEARRELLVLSAQVQAALGEAGGRPDPTMQLNRGRDGDGETASEPPAFADTVFAPEEAVRIMLDEARADMDALAEDARTVPFEALSKMPALPPPEPPDETLHEEPFIAAPSPSPMLSSPSSILSATPSPLLSTPTLSPAASRVLLSSQFPSDAVPVPSSRRVRTLVTLFGIAGVAVLAGTIWWMRGSNTSTTPQTATRSTTTPTPAAAARALTAPASPVAPSTTPAGPAAKASTSSNLSLVVEARRSAWLRTTVDGETDGGRMLAQGDSFRISAQKSVSLRVGDAGAVFVSVNNGDALPLGRAGQVVTRQFVVESTERESGQAPQQDSPAGATPEPLAPPLATSPTGPPSGPTPIPVPIVQPVAAAPPSPAPAPAPTPRAETVPPPAPRAETVPPAARAELPTPGPATPTSAVIAASRQWLDAYQRQDRATMASLSVADLQLVDERRSEERFAANVDVSRSIDRVSVQIAADTAVLTAVMTERAADSGSPPRVSPISQVWVLAGNQWRVRQVRLVSEARLNQIFR
jgi:hypothetical protein